jgi:hypothetical protein
MPSIRTCYQTVGPSNNLGAGLMKLCRLALALPLLLLSSCALAQDQVKAPASAPASPAVASNSSDGPFLVKPYLQLGHTQEEGKLVLVWHAQDADADWGVEFRTGADQGWRKAEGPKSHPVAVAGLAPHRIYHASLKGLAPGASLSYKVSQAGHEVFSAEATAPKAARQRYRFVVFGDCGAGTPEEKAIAYRASLEKPDFVMIPGDIVYERGRATEYRENFWPVYNADAASPGTGAPLLRSTLFTAAPGNHDIANRNLERYPDGLAYFFYWFQPLNGPAGNEGDPHVPKLAGPDANEKAFADAAGKSYPRMGNFSFDYANAHWTVIDSNPYVDWSNAGLRDWVARDLAGAANATWRFVAFHHPGFSSAREHYEQQMMRKIADVLETGRVDLVFNGHVHNYQRSYPLRFAAGGEGDDKPLRAKDGKPAARGKLLVPGHWTLDKSFDGSSQTRANGVIYLITGAGGQHLYNPEQQDEPESWQTFTCKFTSKVHSLTVADVDGPTLSVRQLAADGTELDRFVVTK